LFQPAWVGPLKVGNRFCIQPMEGCDGRLDGHPDELTYRRFERFGSGGAKLIWGEAAAVVPEGRANPRQLVVSPANAKGLARLAEGCRRAHRQTFGSSDDLVLGLQLTHSGRYSFSRPILACHDPLLDERTIVDRKTGRKADADFPLISDDDLWKLVDHYVGAARIAHDVGFQFVDVKQCHRYLLNELLSARTRPGPFGGSLENRTRMARTILERIRNEIPGLTLASRLNLHDGIPFHKGADDVGHPDEYTVPVPNAWGTNPGDPLQPDLAEPLWWIGEMKKIGVSVVNLSLGNPYSSPHLVRPFQTPPPDGYLPPEHPLIGVDRHVSLAGEVQKAYPDLAVVGSGYSFLQEYLFHAAAANIRDGRTTFVGVGRASLSMPDFARQLMETGTLDR
ncbi:MAG: NADH:flavin oxidoreductase, partial [Gemmataceae bacterium]